MATISFEGETHEFPDDFTDEEISTALSGKDVAATTTPQVITAMDDGIPQPELLEKGQDKEAILAFPISRPATLPTETDSIDNPVQSPIGFGASGSFRDRRVTTIKEDVGSFRDKIATIETGGLDNTFIRTRVLPSATTKGSSAYGTFQITQGLLVDYLTRKRKLFDFADEKAMGELIHRQQLALAVGGRDRKSYEKGGRNHTLAKQWAKDLKYDDVGTFLDAFDYGGDLGLGDDTEFQLAYENFGRKMLQDTLKEAKGDELEAASRWHGGAKWKTAKSRKDTDRYREKYTALQQ